MPRRLSRSVLPLALLLVAACTPEPLAWGADPARLAAPESPEARLELAADGLASFVPSPVPPAAWAPPALCEGSARYAAATAREWYVVGWLARDDGSALLAASRSDDGGRSWEPVVAVDSMDRARARCARPAPAIAADSATGHVHVAYFMEAPGGGGVFFAHSGEAGTVFREPVPIIYGTRPVPVSVAVRRDTVAVAYEDPNGGKPRVGLALSHTMGRAFETRLPVVSGKEAAATAPGVALDGGRVAVAWQERNRNGEAAPGLRVRLATWR